MCGILGRGRSGTVYLAKHVELDEYRAIKQVPKTCADYTRFRKEALILKCIRHPGIPIVYDLEEDEEFSYLIEEFLEGDSLFVLVSEKGHFSRAETIRYGIQICHLVYILHSARPIPILYLDLQPKNLLVCHDRVKLIDFDHSVHISEAEHLLQRYGTRGCAAPEQYSGEPLDERTDIYAIGAVLHYMLTGGYPGDTSLPRRSNMDRRLAKIIRTCLKEKKQERYETVEQLGQALEKVWEREQGSHGEGQISSLTIAVAGTAPGVGTTHGAIGLTAHLRWNGISALYVEKNESGMARQLAGCHRTGTDTDGVCVVKGMPMLPRYGEAVKLSRPQYEVTVEDRGTDWQSFLREPADLYLLVCEAKPWGWKQAREVFQSLENLSGLAVFYNHFCGQLCKKLPNPAGEALCFLMPYEPNPFISTKQTRRVYREMLLGGLGRGKGGILRRLLGRGSALWLRLRKKLSGVPWAS